MGSKKHRQKGIMKVLESGKKEHSRCGESSKRKTGLLPEIFTGMSSEEKQVSRPETNRKSNKGGGAEKMQS